MFCKFIKLFVRYKKSSYVNAYFLFLYVQVGWTHINRHLLIAIDTEIATLIPRFRVTRDDPKTWTLHISDVVPEDTGYYACQVNMEPIMNQVGHLQVVGMI